MLFIVIFFLSIFWIVETFKPPNLKIWGFFLRSIIVDSTPIDDFPPSSTYFILFPKSSFTSADVTALTLDEGLALGAAKGNSKIFSNFLVTECLGNLIANDFLLLVIIFEIFYDFLRFRINVKGPGQNFLYSLIKSLFKWQSFFNLWIFR